MKLNMLSNKPYLLRAFYQWIVDSGCTPFLVISAKGNSSIPSEYIENGEIILNVSPDAIRDLNINAKRVDFRASFSGKVHSITTPIGSILSIYAHENGQGMFFEYEEEPEDVGSVSGSVAAAATNKTGASHLKVVK